MGGADIYYEDPKYDLHENPVASLRESCVIFKKILRHLHEGSVSSPLKPSSVNSKIKDKTYKSKLCHLQEKSPPPPPYPSIYTFLPEMINDIILQEQ